MSMKPYGNLEVTGNLMEVGPPKEPTLIRATVDRRQTQPFTLKSLNLNNENRKQKHSNLSLSSNSVKSSSTTNRSSASNSDEASSHKICQIELSKLKKKIDELESQLKSSQKQCKEKDKQMGDLNKNIETLVKQEHLLNEKLSQSEAHSNHLRSELDGIRAREALNKHEYEKLKLEYDNYKSDKQAEILHLKQEHENETRVKNEKLDNLKKQIAGVFKDNSWERQVQIEDLTRELKRAHEENELLTSKVKSWKSSSSAQPHETYELFLNNVLNLIRHSQSSSVVQHELTKLINSNLNYKQLCASLNQSNQKFSKK